MSSFNATPFNSTPFNGLGRLGTAAAATDSFFDAWGSWLLAMTGRHVYALQYPQETLSGDCARWRLVGQSRSSDLHGGDLRATATVVEIDSRSLIKADAWTIDRSIRDAIDRRAFTWRGHRFAGVVHEEVTTGRDDLGGRWLYTYTSRYTLYHYL